MRTLKNVMYLMLAVCAMTVASCSTDDGNESGDTAAEGRMTAKIGGADFQSMEIATSANIVNTSLTRTMTIRGGDSDGKTIVLIINGFDGEGDYEISVDNTITVTASYIEPNISNPQDSQSWSAPYAGSGVAGNIDITSYSDTNVKGTFTFTGKNGDGGSTKSITSGAFNINL